VLRGVSPQRHQDTKVHEERPLLSKCMIVSPIFLAGLLSLGAWTVDNALLIKGDSQWMN
jgi:hypothetical protein